MFAGNAPRLALAVATTLALATPTLAQAPTPAPAPAVKPLAERIAHTDPTKFRPLKAVHAGAGEMQFGVVLGANALDANLLFLHRGVIPPGSGIGQHFHNDCEEMFVVLDGEAQFTVDGRTSVLKGTVGVPDQAGHAHAIYNASDKPLQWMNINVGMTKVYDNFDLGDPRVGVPLDPIPQFMTMRLDRALLKEQTGFRGGKGPVLYRQALGPSVFRTPWSYVDHMVIPPGSEVGPGAQADVSEVYYVLGGAGSFTLDGQTAAIGVGDAIPVRTGETKGLKATGGQPLELMVIGVARDLEAKKRFVAATMAPRR